MQVEIDSRWTARSTETRSNTTMLPSASENHDWPRDRSRLPGLGSGSRDADDRLDTSEPDNGRRCGRPIEGGDNGLRRCRHGRGSPRRARPSTQTQFASPERRRSCRRGRAYPQVHHKHSRRHAGRGRTDGLLQHRRIEGLGRPVVLEERLTEQLADRKDGTGVTEPTTFLPVRARSGIWPEAASPVQRPRGTAAQAK